LTVQPPASAWLATPVSVSSSQTVDRASGAAHPARTWIVPVATSPSAYVTFSVAW
jgi:hypothetical protein